MPLFIIKRSSGPQAAGQPAGQERNCLCISRRDHRGESNCHSACIAEKHLYKRRVSSLHHHYIGAGQPLLLPLTSSLYVPGALAETEKVLIDIGTGYYVEVSPRVRYTMALWLQLLKHNIHEPSHNAAGNLSNHEVLVSFTDTSGGTTCNGDNRLWLQHMVARLSLLISFFYNP